MSHFVYVLRSERHGTRYVGSTAEVVKRLQEHNNGRCRYTSGRRPWQLIYQEEFETSSEARRRETFLKSGVGRKELDKISGNSAIVAGWCNGSTPGSGPGNLGSNPSPAGSAPEAHPPPAENPSPAGLKMKEGIS